MTFTAIYQSTISRLIAMLIIGLVISPYTAPFATIDGADYGGSAAVDVGGSAKSKTDSPDVVVSSLSVVVAPSWTVVPTVWRPAILDPADLRRPQHAILKI